MSMKYELKDISELKLDGEYARKVPTVFEGPLCGPRPIVRAMDFGELGLMPKWVSDVIDNDPEGFAAQLARINDKMHNDNVRIQREISAQLSEAYKGLLEKADANDSI